MCFKKNGDHAAEAVDGADDGYDDYNDVDNGNGGLKAFVVMY
jgi:hypothetical protein